MKGNLKPKIILVLGMHRSGTSLVAQLIAKWGAFMGDDLMRADNYNQDGYWEYNPLVHFHEKLLKKTNNKWYTPSEEINTEELLTEFGDEARQLVMKMDLSGEVWCWKDPRMPLFLDFWKQILAGREIIYVLVNRPPNDIAASLLVRDKIPASLSLSLWEYITINIFQKLAIETNYKFIDYEKLILQPGIYCKELFNYLNNSCQLLKKQEIYEKMVLSVKKSLNHAKPIKIKLSPSQKKLQLIIEKENIPSDFEMSEHELMFLKDIFSLFTKFEVNNHTLQFAQLFYNNKIIDFDENQSLITEVKDSPQAICFKFENPQLVNNLRFDPLNNYLQVRISSISLLHQGKTLDVPFMLSSNAISSENTVYLFDTKDPQIYIDFKNDISLKIDEVIIDLEYIKIGIEALESISEFKEGIINTKRDEIYKRLQENEIILKQNESLEKRTFIAEDKNQRLQISYDQLEQHFDTIKLDSEKNKEEINKQLLENKVLTKYNENLIKRLKSVEEKKHELQILADKLFSSQKTLEKQNLYYNESIINLEIKLTESFKTIDDLSIRLKQSVQELDNLKSIPGIRYFHKIMFSIKPFLPVEGVRAIFSKLRYFRSYFIIKHSDLFDEAYYLSNNPDIIESEISAIKHFILFGGIEGRNPSENFDSNFYLQENLDVKHAGLNPLLHYQRIGKNEERKIKSTHTAISKDPVLPSNTIKDKKNIISNILEKLNNKDDLIIIKNSVFFDAEYYERAYSDVRNSGLDPVTHYYYYGWKEGRNPGPFFDTLYYLLTYQDVRKSGTNPLVHFIRDGQKEGRLPKAFKINEEECLKKADIFEIKNEDAKDHFKIALVCHIYYIEFIDEIIGYLKKLPFSYDLFISTQPEKLKIVKDLFINRLPLIETKVLPFENRGRDIAPFIAFLKSDLYHYDLVCKIHTKNSKHDINLKNWRNYLLDNLLGHSKIIETIYSSFEENSRLGMIWPVIYPYIAHLGMEKGWGNSDIAKKNYFLAETYFPEMQLNELPTDFIYPAGSMFWFRPEALKLLINKKIDVSNFEKEEQQVDGTLAHAIERLFGLMAQSEGFENKTVFFPRVMLSNLKKTQIILEDSKSILFVAHDLFRAGAEMLLLHILQWMHDYTSFNIYVLAIKKGADGGRLLTAYQKVSKVILWEEYCSEHDEYQAIERIKQEFGSIDLIYGNTIVSSGLFKLLRVFKAPFISHIHELEQSINKYSTPEIRSNMKKFTSVFIACSLPVEKNLINNHDIPIQKIRCIHEFIKPTLPSLLNRSLQRELLGLPSDKTIIWGCGTIYWRKGTDLFIETAKKLKDKGVNNFVLCWIGGNHWDNDSKDWGYWKEWEEYIVQNKLNETVVFLEEQDNPKNYFIAGDIFYLPSREDPFPLVCLEAAECSLPIICFEDAGGMSEFVGKDAGIVIPNLNIDYAASAIEKLIYHENLRNEMGSKARTKLLNRHSVDMAVPEILKVCHSVMKSQPLVSVIVPVYNHEKYLVERIKSILDQTFRDFEILILDDASTDRSFEIAQTFASHPAITILRNIENSGSPFKQWQKGVLLAKGKYIWIAEGDDKAEPTLLETLLQNFIDPDVVLAYCASHCLNENNEIYDEHYLKVGHYNNLNYPSDRWHKSYSAIGLDEIHYALAVRNTIPNVSAVLWQGDKLRQVNFEDCTKFKTTGDWFAYVSVLKYGKINYQSEHLNFHRVHSDSVVARNKKKAEETIPDYFEMHKMIAKNFKLDENILFSMTNSVSNDLRNIWPELSDEQFQKLYDVNYILNVYES